MSPIPKWWAEGVGTALLLMAVTASGVMGEALAGGNAAVVLLANSLVTGAALYVILSLLGPISGAHLNPLVSLMAWFAKALTTRELFAYVIAQLLGAIAGVWLTHLMFRLPLCQWSTKPRAEPALWLSELIATVILLSLIRLASQRQDPKTPVYLACTVFVGYWATSSTFFVNPAATLARSLTNTFVGIRPIDIAPFIAAQCLALILVLIASKRWRR